jgi:hypothetical protein
MNDISSLLNRMYATDQSVSMEKTAEDALLASLQGSGQAEHNPYAGMSTADLQKLAHEIEHGEPQGEDPSLLEKTAAEMLAGQVMAHAMHHEMSLIKVAMVNGLCRVCKSSPSDVAGSSICSGCLSEA